MIHLQSRRGANQLLELVACIRGELPDTLDWDQVILLANEHLLGPRLYRGIVASAGAGMADPEAMDYLASLDAANRERNARLMAQLAELTQALAAEGVTLTILKGAAELVRSRPQGASPRMLRDLDVMIRGDAAARTDAVLRALGYDTFPEDPGSHSAGCYFRPGDVGSVDVHLRLPMLFAHLVPPEEMALHSETVPLGDSLLRVPDASLQFVINLGHEMLHDQALASGSVHLGYLLELTSLAANPAAPLDWAWILGKCRSAKFRLGLEVQARMARHVGLGDFPAVEETRLGALLHRRRLVKLAHPGFGDVEWQVVRWAKDLRHFRKVQHG